MVRQVRKSPKVLVIISEGNPSFGRFSPAGTERQEAYFWLDFLVFFIKEKRTNKNYYRIGLVTSSGPPKAECIEK